MDATWMEGGFGKWLGACPACSPAWQTDKINAKVNKDIVVPEKERARDLSLLARSLARWPRYLSVFA